MTDPQRLVEKVRGFLEKIIHDNYFQRVWDESAESLSALDQLSAFIKKLEFSEGAPKKVLDFQEEFFCGRLAEQDTEIKKLTQNVRGWHNAWTKEIVEVERLKTELAGQEKAVRVKVLQEVGEEIKLAMETERLTRDGVLPLHYARCGETIIRRVDQKIEEAKNS